MPNFAMITFGCQMNQHDSDRIVGTLRHAGYARTEALEDADLVMLNTCSVREKAEQKLRSEVGRLLMLKRERPELRIGVAGCVAQQEGARLIKSMPGVDLVIGPDNIGELPGILGRLELGGLPEVRAEFDLEAPRFLGSELLVGPAPVSAYVTTMKGCNERCSFCIVPTTRGPERYRPASEILDEVAGLAARGVREVTLLGQTVNSYQDIEACLPKAPGAAEPSWRHTRGARAREDESSFAALLWAIQERAPDLKRLRYTSPHPRHLTRSLIRAHRDLNLLARHVHLPVQSGSDPMLKRMLRRYSRAEYLERVAALREEVSNVTLSTDVIVGFPGERQEDFEATMSLLEEVGFSGVFAFKYSPRPGTPALKLDGEPTEEEKSRRLALLLELVNRQRVEHLKALVGTEQEVLVEGRDKTGKLSGRTERNEIVHVEGPEQLVGQMPRVRITQAFKNSLLGELTEERAAAPLEGRRRRNLRVLP